MRRQELVQGRGELCPRPGGKWIIYAEFVEDAYDYAADLISGFAGGGNRFDERVQGPFVVTSVERRERSAQIQPFRTLEPDPGSEALGCVAPMNMSEDLESLFLMAAAMEDTGELDGCTFMARLELQGRAERLLIALLSQQFRLRREK